MLNEKCMFVKIDFVTFHKVPHIWDKTNRQKLAERKSIEAKKWILFDRTYY